MKFKRVLSNRSSIKKQKDYDFTEDGITEELIEKGRKHTYQKPLLVKLKFGLVYGIYSDRGKVRITMYHTFTGFEEIVA